MHQRLMDENNLFTMHPDPLLPYNVNSSSYNNNTQEPSVVIKDGILEVFFIGVGFSNPGLAADDPDQSVTSVGLARSVFDFNLQLIENPDGYILQNANITEVKYYDKMYHVYSTTLETGEFHQNEKINYYSSTDCKTWSGPKILISSETTFDNWGVMAPTVVVEEDSLILFYTGWSAENHECFPEPFTSSVRFGYPGFNDSKCIYGSIIRAVSSRK
jgi:hypothetical protein